MNGNHDKEGTFTHAGVVKNADGSTEIGTYNEDTFGRFGSDDFDIENFSRSALRNATQLTGLAVGVPATILTIRNIKPNTSDFCATFNVAGELKNNASTANVAFFRFSGTCQTFGGVRNQALTSVTSLEVPAAAGFVGTFAIAQSGVNYIVTYTPALAVTTITFDFTVYRGLGPNTVSAGL